MTICKRSKVWEFKYRSVVSVANHPLKVGYFEPALVLKRVWFVRRTSAL
jgi:hypothetical protein